MMETQNSFEEVQKGPLGATFWLLVSVESVVLVILSYGLVQQLVLGVPFGNKPVSDPLLAGIEVFLLAVLCGTIGLSVNLRLEIQIDQQILRFRMPPLQRKWTEVAFSEIQNAESVVVHPWADFGGTGIRIGKGRVAYLVTRGTAVRITRNGSILVLGSQKADEMLAALP